MTLGKRAVTDIPSKEDYENVIEYDQLGFSLSDRKTHTLFVLKPETSCMLPASNVISRLAPKEKDEANTWSGA